MTAMDRLAEIEQRADAAGEGPWRADPHGHMEAGCRCGSCYGTTVWWTSNGLFCDDITPTDEDRTRCETHGYTYEDAEFIAHARTDVPALVAALRAVLDLHQRRPCRGCIDEVACQGICDKCGTLYPCREVHTVTEALGGGA